MKKLLALLFAAGLTLCGHANTLQSYPTVTTPAADDWLYVQGATNSVRKLSPLYYDPLPTVTTNTGTTYTVLITDGVITLNNASPVTVTLPLLATVPQHSKPFLIKNIGTGLVTVTRGGSDTIFIFSSGTSFSIGTGEAVELRSSPTAWLTF